MKELGDNLLKHNWNRDFYSCSNGKEKQFVWEVAQIKITQSQTELSLFYQDKVSIYTFLVSLMYKEDLWNEFSLDFQVKLYDFIKKQIKYQELIIQDQDLYKSYGMDIAGDIKGHAFDSIQKLRPSLKRLRQRILSSSNPLHRLKVVF